MNVNLRRASFLPLLVGLALPALALAQEPGASPAESRGPYSRHPEAVKAIAQLKSPYCPGFMLEVCTSREGHALRDSIGALAEEGWPADSIVGWVLARHGNQYLALPPRRGKALVAWVVPPLAVLTGLGVVIVALRQMQRSRPRRRPEEEELSPDDEARLQEALRELEAEEEAPFL